MYWVARSTSIAPVRGFPYKVFGLTFFKIRERSWQICLTNSGLSWDSSDLESFCSKVSSSTGLTSVKQSRSGKKFLTSLRIRFFFSAASLVPLWSLRPISKYSFWVSSLPCWSLNCKAKSLRTQKKVGKYCATSSASSHTSPCLI